MTMNTLTVDAVSLALDVAQRRAEVASHNIARVNVPGARMERADFASAMALLGRVAHGDAVASERLRSTVVGVSGTDRLLADGAAVSLDDQVAEMALSSAHFQALSEAVNRQFGLMSIALSGDQA